MASQKFGSGHTLKKLQFLDKYLEFFTQALSSKPFRLVYIDAFAGTGEILLMKSDAPTLPGIASDSEMIEGSAVRALSTKHPFNEYIFIEKSRSKITRLESELTARFPDRIARCGFKCADANEAIKDFCAKTNWRQTRAILFLDPFGNQIEWQTLQVIAATGAIDVWYLFPSGLGVYRQIPGEGKPQDDHAASVTRILGTDEWISKFTQETKSVDLFGAEQISTRKTGNVDEITTYAIGRLRTLFKGGVLDEWVGLGGKHVPWYSLLFACSNPSPAAKNLAHKVAKWIVSKR